MMMTERQLKAARAEKSDSTVTKKFESDIKRLETKLQVLLSLSALYLYLI